MMQLSFHGIFELKVIILLLVFELQIEQCLLWLANTLFTCSDKVVALSVQRQ